MKRLLNTLYVTTQGAYLAREGETVLVRIEHDTKLRIPIHTLGGIVCFGQVSCSPQLMGLCGEHGVMISFLSMYGRFYARVQGPVSGNVLLRREHYRRADDEIACSSFARAVIAAKIVNCRRILQRALRDHPDHGNRVQLKSVSKRMADLLRELRETCPLDRIRGVEGEAARAYFGVFDHLITTQKDDFFFHKRSRRPPLDNMNTLLSFLYSLLASDATNALESVGLDPAVGFFHRDRPGRSGLALDLMEEFRPYLVDRLVLTLVNRQQVKSKGFKRTESGAVMMNDTTRKDVLVAYQKRKQEEIQHPFLKEKVALGLLPHVQAMLLARHLRGDLDGYPPFFWK